MNVITPTDLSTKATEVISNVYRSFGGSGSNPDTAEFKKTLADASPDQVAKAHRQIWKEIIQPLTQQGGQALPTNVQEEVALVAERMYTLFTDASMGARSSV